MNKHQVALETPAMGDVEFLACRQDFLVWLVCQGDSKRWDTWEQAYREYHEWRNTPDPIEDDEDWSLPE